LLAPGCHVVITVSLPVKAYTATDSGGEVHLNQLHAECKSRIEYKKTCPIHGAVTDDQIVSGHECDRQKCGGGGAQGPARKFSQH